MLESVKFEKEIEKKKKKYLELWEMGKAVFDKLNPCKIVNSTCDNPNYGKDLGLCCGGCRHLGPQGCTVQSLGCKLWTCYHLQSNPNNKELLKELAVLRSEAYKHDIPMGVRASFEENFHWHENKLRILKEKEAREEAAA